MGRKGVRRELKRGNDRRIGDEKEEFRKRVKEGIEKREVKNE